MFKLEPPCGIILHHIHMSWLYSINAKVQQNFPVYLSNKKRDGCYGYIERFESYPEHIDFYQIDDSMEDKTKLKLNLVVSKQDVMQYFFQWQRYRKYWWSSITTTPSLFLVNDMKYEDTNVKTEIAANFNCGQKVVEHLSINYDGNDSSDKANITCCMSVETALLTLLMDGHMNKNKDGYLRLHNKMAPYKISFVLNSTDVKKLETLKELATLLHNQLNVARIRSWLPTFAYSSQEQLEENLKIGVPYTAVLNNETLSNGIFHLLNSSTMLKEQVHIADFENYACSLFK